MLSFNTLPNGHVQYTFDSEVLRCIVDYLAEDTV